MRRTISWVLCAVIVMAASPALAFTENQARDRAAEILQERQTQIQERVSDAEETNEAYRQRVEEKLQLRCATIEERIVGVTTRYQERKERHLEVYEAVRNRVTGLLDRLDERGYNTAEARALLPEFTAQMEALRSQTQAMVGELEQTKSHACGESQGNFADALIQTRQQTRLSAEAVKGVRNYYRETLRPALQALKDQQLPL